MSNFDSIFRRLSFTSLKSEVATLEFKPEELDSDIEALKQRAKIQEHKFDVNSIITKKNSEQQLESLLSEFLKYGVLLASLVVLLGGILYLIRHGDEPARYYQFFRGEPSILCSPKGVIQAGISGSSRGIIQLGILLMVGIPILRVIICFVAFVKARELTYTLISLLVMTALIYSLLEAYL